MKNVYIREHEHRNLSGSLLGEDGRVGFLGFLSIRLSSTSGFSAQNLWKSIDMDLLKSTWMCVMEEAGRLGHTYSPNETMLFTVTFISLRFFCLFV